jgi:hypothetical protein
MQYFSFLLISAPQNDAHAFHTPVRTHLVDECERGSHGEHHVVSTHAQQPRRERGMREHRAQRLEAGVPRDRVRKVL